jgi:ankyrin repeat protein
MQILSGAFHSYQEYSQGNYIEAVSGTLMVIVRMNQTAAPVRELHQKWQASIQSRKEAIIGCNTAKADIGVTRNSSPELVDILVKYGNNPKGIPPLHYAVLQGDFPAVKLLVENGANVNLRANNGPPRTDLNDQIFAHKLIRYYQGATPIDYAATSSRLEILQYLHQHGAVLDEIAVIKTARACSLECLKYLLSNGASLPKESGELIYGMLFSASGSILTGNIEAVKILIRAGADCTYTYTEHFTFHGCDPFVKLGLLSLDSTLSDLELVKLFVEHGAPINYAMERMRSKQDPKELHVARPKLIWDMDFNPLCKAVQQGKEEAAAYLLSEGALLTNNVQHHIWEMCLAATAQGKAQRKIALNLNMFNKEYIQCLFDRLIISPLFDVIDFQDLKELHKRGAQIRDQNLRDALSLGEKGRELIAWLLSNGAKLQ